MKTRFLRLMMLGVTASMMLQPGITPTITAFAAGTEAVPSAADTIEVTVNNVEDAAKVTAYRLTVAYYDDDGFLGFRNTIDGVSIADLENPTSDEITKIARDIKAGTLTPETSVQLTGNGSTYSAQLGAGEWIILVENTDMTSATYSYNPMVVSSYYTDANLASSLTAAGVDADSTYSIGTANLYAKRTTIPLDKEISSPDGVNGLDDDYDTNQLGDADAAQGDDLQVGDIGSFKITTKIPEYSKAYTTVTYTMTDTQDDGFDAPTDIKVYVDGEEAPVREGQIINYDVDVSGNDFTVTFNSDYVLANAGKDVMVTYKAALNSNAVQKMDPNNDTVKLVYTNDLYGHTTELTDDVQEYTFPVSVKKVNEDQEGLQGADFTLTRVNDDGSAFTSTDSRDNYTVTITTDENGIAQFDRLDEGTYTIKETEAPQGYTINDITYTLKITPVYGADGKLENYTAALTDNEGGAVGSVTVSNADDDILAGNITDTRLQVLPGTGGNGTKIAVMAAAGMAGVTVILFAAAKKKEKAEKAA